MLVPYKKMQIDHLISPTFVFSCEFMVLKCEIYVNLCWIQPLNHCSMISKRKQIRNLMNLTC